MTAPTYLKTEPAARFIERHALDESDEKWLKEALGLVQPDGALAPDDNTVYHFPTGDRGPGAVNPNAWTAMPRPARDRSAVPPGLANLPPAEPAPKKRRGPKPQPKVVRPKKPREVPECGTHRAFARHKRRGEEVDAACLEASREYSRNYSRERTARLKREAELKRLTDAGVNGATAQVLSELAR